VVRATSEVKSTLFFCLARSSILATIFFSLLTYYAVRTLAFPRTWTFFAAVGVALVGWTFLGPFPPSNWIWYVYFGLMLIEVIRVEATGEKIKREGTSILLRGFLVVIAIVVLQALINLGLVPPIAGFGN